MCDFEEMKNGKYKGRIHFVVDQAVEEKLKTRKKKPYGIRDKIGSRMRS